MDCLAAQMFVHFKSSGCKDDGTPTSNAGGIYCMHPDTTDCFEEYLYEISKGDDCILITVYETHYESDTEEIFHGTPKELLTKIKKEEYA